jgi:hypothetical protein
MADINVTYRNSDGRITDCRITLHVQAIEQCEDVPFGSRGESLVVLLKTGFDAINCNQGGSVEIEAI